MSRIWAGAVAPVGLAICLCFAVLIGPGASPAFAKGSITGLKSIVLAHPAPGYSLKAQGVLTPGAFTTSAPDPLTAAAALRKLSRSGQAQTYERTWQGPSRLNEIEDLVVRFSDISDAKAFLTADERALASGEGSQSAPLHAIPGASLTSYTASNSKGEDGMGQAIVMRSGTYVATMSFFSVMESANSQAISATKATQVALTQFSSIYLAPGGGLSLQPSDDRDSVIGWAAVATAVLVAFLFARRLRRAGVRKTVGVFDLRSDRDADRSDGRAGVVARPGQR